MLFLLTDYPQKLKLENINVTLIILFYLSSSSPELERISFFIKNTKKNILRQVTGRNAPIIVSKTILGYFLKVPLLEKMLEFQN